MKYRPSLSGPSAPWVDEDDLPLNEIPETIDWIAAVLSARLNRRADELRYKPDWFQLNQEIRAQIAGAAAMNDVPSILRLNDLLLELVNLDPEPKQPVASVPVPLPWDQEEIDLTADTVWPPDAPELRREQESNDL
jgi:hypothetical protein